MSKVYEKYLESKNRESPLTNDVIRLAELEEELSESSEKESCLFYGIPCSFGICDECDIAERR